MRYCIVLYMCFKPHKTLQAETSPSIDLVYRALETAPGGVSNGAVSPVLSFES